MDKGQKETEAILKNLEKRINAEYSKAIIDLEDELTQYLARYKKKDETWRRWVEDGVRTPEEYERWRVGQIAVGKRWEAQKDLLAQELLKANDMARAMANDKALTIFADNFNFATYQVEKDASINTSFTLYSRETVEELIANDPDVLPAPGKKTSKAIADGKAVRWDKQQLQSVMIQGILQGDSIPKLATRLAETVGDRDRKAAIRNARTMATRAQNAGRVNAYKRAQDKGVELEQMWLATLDGRTRHSHRWLDGEVRPLGEDFSNGCAYPGDPKGKPAEIYNCRCSIRGVVKGLDRISGKFRDDSAIEGMSYDEWRNARSKSNPITLQEEKGQAIKRSYLADYMNNGIIGDDIRDGILGGSPTIKALTDQSVVDSVIWVDVKPLSSPLTESQIISKVGAPDYTDGSCASLAWAYLGNKAGYDVRDFRGGDSAEIFASRKLFMGFVRDNNIKHVAARSTNDISCAKKLLRTMEDGKEYLLRTGEHAAIVRKKGRGYEYLELQTSGNNGFQPLNSEELKYRFGCRGMHLFDGDKRKLTSILVDADSLSQNEAFANLLGYINTVLD